MRLLLPILFASFFNLVTKAAEGPSRIYLDLYLLREEAAQSESKGDYIRALAIWQANVTFLEGLRKRDPSWMSDRLESQLEESRSRMTSVEAPASAELLAKYQPTMPSGSWTLPAPRRRIEGYGVGAWVEWKQAELGFRVVAPHVSGEQATGVAKELDEAEKKMARIKIEVLGNPSTWPMHFHKEL